MGEIRTQFEFAHLVGLYGFQRLRETFSPKTQSTPKLSGQSWTILTWAAAGRSSWETGETLNISRRTVDGTFPERQKSLARKIGPKLWQSPYETD